MVMKSFRVVIPLVILLWGIVWFHVLAPAIWHGHPDGGITYVVYFPPVLLAWAAAYRLAHR